MVDWSDPINKDLRGCWLFNEAAGNAAFDASGRFGKAALGAGQTWTQGHLSCSGSNSNATVSASPSIDIVGKFSGSVWVYPKVSNVYQVLFSRSSGGIGTDRQYSFLLSGAGTAKLWFALGGTDIGDVTVSPTWTVNKWNHLVLTADGTNARLYINGVLANTTTTVKVPTSQAAYPLVFGAEGTGFPLNGLLGSERIFARVLSHAEIRRLYAEPYAGILAPRRRLWSVPASGGGVTVSIVAGAMTLVGAGVAQAGKSASVAVGILLLAGATIGARAGKSAAVAAGVLLLAGGTITAIVSGANASITAGVLLLAGAALTIAAGKSVAVATSIVRLVGAGISASGGAAATVYQNLRLFFGIGN